MKEISSILFNKNNSHLISELTYKIQQQRFNGQPGLGWRGAVLDFLILYG